MSEQSTIGAQLRQAREKRGESFEQTHQRTGIGVRVLRGLEEDATDVVEIVYMRMALMSYAEHLGLEVDELARRFDEVYGSPEPQPRQLPTPLPTSAGSDLIARLNEIPRTWLIGAAVVAIVSAILLVGYLIGGGSEPAETRVSQAPLPQVSPALPAPVATDLQSRDREPRPAPAEGVPSPPLRRESVAPTSETSAEVDGPTDSAPPATELTHTPPPADSAQTAPARLPVTSPAHTVAPDTAVVGGPLVLQARAVDSTWVRVQRDGAPPVEEIIPRGRTRRWEAHDSLLVVAGRAHGVQFRFQDELLGNGRLGTSTEVLRFRASRDGVYLLAPDLSPTSRVDNLQDSSATASDAAGL